MSFIDDFDVETGGSFELIDANCSGNLPFERQICLTNEIFHSSTNKSLSTESNYKFNAKIDKSGGLTIIGIIIKAIIDIFIFHEPLHQKR